MKYYKILLVAFFTISLVLSCTLESEYALPNNEKIMPELLGEWKSSENANEVLKFSKKNDKIYHVLFNVNNDKNNEMTAYLHTIEDHVILNLIETKDNKTTNMFHKVSVSDDQLTYYEVNTKIAKSEINSQKELLQYFKNNIHKEDFFINPNVVNRSRK